ncbi:MAG: hypothetical protein WA555_15140 [Candidatus Sulfotelmatobacter sp.]
MNKKLQNVFPCALMLAVIPFALPAGAQEPAPAPKTVAPRAEDPAPDAAGKQYSGMYSFLKDGEFVQVTVEDAGMVTGFISRYGEAATDPGAFVDQFFRTAKLEGNQLSFTTETVHGVWFEFKGAVQRGEGKNPGDEAYYVLKGTLTDNTSDAQRKVTTRSRAVVLKRFPEN